MRAGEWAEQPTCTLGVKARAALSADGTYGTYGTDRTYVTEALIGPMSPIGRIRCFSLDMEPSRAPFATSPYRHIAPPKKQPRTVFTVRGAQLDATLTLL